MAGLRVFWTTASLAMLLAGCGQGEGAKAANAEPPVPVLVSAVREAPEAANVIAYGTVRSDKEGALSFKIGGLIKSLKVDTGDRVKKGQILAELDQREIDAEASRASVQVEKARRDLDRIAPLLEKGFVSRQRVQDAKSNYDMAVADRQTVEFNRSLATITAPADGVVLQRHSDVNEIVAAGAPVLTVSQGSTGYILKAGLSDRDVARLALGSRARVMLDAFPGVTLDGVLRRISATSDEKTGTFEVEIALQNVPQGAESGFMGEARIAAKPVPGRTNVAIPASAILEGHGGTATVYRLDPATSTAELVRVTVAGVDGDDVLISDGLAPGAEVVSAGAPYLRDGAKVKIVTDLAPEAAGPEPRS
ncbi:MAG: efflux RND transporter periplasmic adaptor subunit [Parvibaculum sp.]|jgi:RND family efflux transporter MFP subunit|uniref:efflux RND transporter periplasmic adaptor subunit n=1 Tax=Parvibaculum sp. TaxID=2024848 RepID=UPI0028519C75|nr:efflux RND transporter periplasmic adaptor subunit [Parvibaculum sp.]MDR3500252.1 efflux RND transporter periplasmic adaptor subunit [Parvibaculum sp.]